MHGAAGQKTPHLFNSVKHYTLSSSSLISYRTGVGKLWSMRKSYLSSWTKNGCNIILRCFPPFIKKDMQWELYMAHKDNLSSGSLIEKKIANLYSKMFLLKVLEILHRTVLGTEFLACF